MHLNDVLSRAFMCRPFDTFQLAESCGVKQIRFDFINIFVLNIETISLLVVDIVADTLDEMLKGVLGGLCRQF